PGPGVTVTEDADATVTGVSIADVDDEGQGTVTFTADPTAAGTLALDMPGATGGGTSNVSVTSTLADTNAALTAGKLVFTPTADRDTDAAITVEYTDDGSKTDTQTESDTDTVPLMFVPVNDVPVVTTGAAVPVTEDTATPIPGVSVADVDDEGQGTI